MLIHCSELTAESEARAASEDELGQL